MIRRDTLHLLPKKGQSIMKPIQLVCRLPGTVRSEEAQYPEKLVGWGCFTTHMDT